MMRWNRDTIVLWGSEGSREDLAMRRPVWVVSLGSFLIVLAVLMATRGNSSSAPNSNLAYFASPVAEEYAPGLVVSDLGTLALYATPEVVPRPDATPTPMADLRLKKVTLEPNAVPSTEGDSHNGAFVLSVESGTICYTYLEADGDDPTVTAIVAKNVPVPVGCPTLSLICPGADGCSPPRTDCADADGCELQPFDTVYLPAGSSVLQTDSTLHWYGNVDPVDTAVVYLAEYQPETDSAPCGSGCP